MLEEAIEVIEEHGQAMVIHGVIYAHLWVVDCVGRDVGDVADDDIAQGCSHRRNPWRRDIQMM